MPEIRRAWRCRRCGRSVVLITRTRAEATPPRCNHTGTIKADEPDYPMHRTKRPGPPR